MPDVQRRGELKAFLASRRARIPPESVGFVANPRRRSPGLNREQVAELAGVSFKWYTLFESGAPINISHETVAAVCRVLQLDYDETHHVLVLSGLREAPYAPPPPATNPIVMQHILDGFRAGPAAILSPRLDILAVNDLCTRVLGYAMDSPPLERNVLWSFFVCRRRQYVNWEEAASTRVAVFRAHYARHQDDPEFAALIEALRAQSPDFERIWTDLDVTSLQRTLRLIVRNAAGLLAFDGLGLPMDETGDTTVFFYAAADALTTQRLELLKHPQTAVREESLVSA